MNHDRRQHGGGTTLPEQSFGYCQQTVRFDLSVGKTTAPFRSGFGGTGIITQLGLLPLTTSRGCYHLALSTYYTVGRTRLPVYISAWFSRRSNRVTG